MLTYNLCCDICGIPNYPEQLDRKELRKQTKEDGWRRRRKHNESRYSDICPTCVLTYDPYYNYEEDDEVRVTPRPLKIV